MSDGDAQWVDVGAAASLPDGEMVSAMVSGCAVVVYRADGQLYATNNVCTHNQALLSDGWLDGCVIECPLHGGQFDIKTGAGLCAPIEEDIRTHHVREHEGRIQVLVEGDGS